MNNVSGAPGSNDRCSDTLENHDQQFINQGRTSNALARIGPTDRQVQRLRSDRSLSIGRRLVVAEWLRRRRYRPAWRSFWESNRVGVWSYRIIRAGTGWCQPGRLTPTTLLQRTVV